MEEKLLQRYDCFYAIRFTCKQERNNEYFHIPSCQFFVNKVKSIAAALSYTLVICQKKIMILNWEDLNRSIPYYIALKMRLPNFKGVPYLSTSLIYVSSELLPKETTESLFSFSF